MVSALDSGSSGPGSIPGRGHCGVKPAGRLSIAVLEEDLCHVTTDVF